MLLNITQQLVKKQEEFVQIKAVRDRFEGRGLPAYRIGMYFDALCQSVMYLSMML